MASTFVDSWQVDLSNDVNQNCSHTAEDDESMELVCTDEVKAQAQIVCKKMLTNPKFSNCLMTMQEEALMDSCVSDYCYCDQEKREMCACNGLTVFAKECLFRGIKLDPKWRDMKVCRKCSGIAFCMESKI